jgi:hypothetical protein
MELASFDGFAPSVDHLRSDRSYTDGWRPTADYDLSRVGYFNPEVSKPDFEQKYDRKSRSRDFGGVIRDWHSLIRNYTNRTLSVPTDRILAISGVAERYGKVFQSKHFAGLREFAFPFALLWRIRSLTRKPLAYQGPSWSWTSINGEVSYADANFRRKEEARLELIGCQLELTNRDAPYGAVRCGRLTVRGRMLPARWMRPGRAILLDFEDEYPLRKRDIDGIDGVLAAHMEPDALEDEFAETDVDSIPVLLLETSRYGRPDEHRSQGLVLRAMEDLLFRRLGTFEFVTRLRSPGRFEKALEESQRDLEKRVHEQQHYFDGCEPQTITIV